MLPDVSKGVILEGLTDANLAKTYKNDVLEFLLRVPANQRQNVLAEVHNRMYDTVFHRGRDGDFNQMEDVLKTSKSQSRIFEEILTENDW